MIDTATETAPDAAFDAIVLAGGRARRLGGIDKLGQRIEDVTLLDRVLAAVAGAAQVLVVGPQRPVAHRVRWCREEPAGGGPVAGIAAALPLVASERVLVVAGDLPWFAPAVALLLAELSPAEAAVLIDGDGRRNVLAAAWRTPSLRAAVAAVDTPAGRPVRALYAGVRVAEVPDTHGWGADCDTWDDLRAARHRAREESNPT